MQTALNRITGSPSSKYVVYATACVYRELYGKITDRKKQDDLDRVPVEDLT